MDEAVSNLDSESEEALHTAMHEVRRGRTVLIIAHRPSTIRTADRILLLEGGHIVEDGTHEALLAKGGAYQRLILAKQQEAAGATPAAGTRHRLTPDRKGGIYRTRAANGAFTCAGQMIMACRIS